MTASHARTLTISRAIQRDDVMLETLTFLLSHNSQTFKIKENRIFKQKTRDISYRDRERRLPRRKVEYISSWRGKGSLVFTSHIFISHCVSLSSIHYTWFMCLHLHARCGCLVTPSWVSADQHSCPRVPVSLTDTQLSHLSGPNHPRVAAGIFSPGPGSAPRSTPVHSSALWRVRSAVTDHGWEKSEDGHKSRSQAACAGTGITWHGHGCCLPGLGLDTTPRKLIF